MLATVVAKRAGIDGNDGRSEAPIQQQISSLPFESNDHGQCSRRVRECRGGREKASGEIRGVSTASSSSTAIGRIRAVIPYNDACQASTMHTLIDTNMCI